MRRPTSAYQLCSVVLLLMTAVMTLTCSEQILRLAAPLTTLVPIRGTIEPGPCYISAEIDADQDVREANIGISGYVADRHGRWFQLVYDKPLRPGRNKIKLHFTRDAVVTPSGHNAAWDATFRARITQAGFTLWSTKAYTGQVRLIASHHESISEQYSDNTALENLEFETGPHAGTIHVNTGQRWSLSVNPRPFPINPFDPTQFTLDATFEHESGMRELIPGFAMEPHVLRDRGDREVGAPKGPHRFVVRWRPRLPGKWTLKLNAKWASGATVSYDAPSVVVHGEPWDDYVRIDASDHRFFSTEGRWYFPIGVNLHSTFDVRSRQRLGTILSPERGSAAYAARFARMKVEGLDACEIWMSAWNMALEWNAEWPGYGGIGQYNQFNAEKLDRVLDDAWNNGIRINLVLNNHGQAAPSADREWKDNPWNSANGGPLQEPYELFTKEIAFIGQRALRRYIIARYADHPAIFGWKLYSEINLTAMGDRQRSGWGSSGTGPLATYEERVEARRAWHEAASADFKRQDVYKHPVTTHWSGDYRKPYPEICALPGIDYIGIDAYHGGGRSSERNNALVDLIYFGTLDPSRGLSRFEKPVWVTEFGGTSQGGSSPELTAELASAGWAAVMSGNAGMPMLWWFEWIEQGERWQSFGALRRFLVGEDFRGKDARGVVLAVKSDNGPLWARAWARSGRMLGYVADHEWAAVGESSPQHEAARVTIGTQISGGKLGIEWWDAELGQCIKTETISHPGGLLVLHPVPFKRHIAFKLTRQTQ